MIFEALDVVGGFDFILEPSKRLGEHREAQEADHIQAQNVLGQFAVELGAAAGVEPGQHGGGRTAKNRTGTEQRRGLGFAVPVNRHRMGRIEYAVVTGIEDLKRADHRAGRKQVNFQPVARHLLDSVFVLACEVHPDV